MFITINCLCGKQFKTEEKSELADNFKCGHCGREYYKDFYMENGEFRYTFKVRRRDDK